jgi:hypothetical protein
MLEGLRAHEKVIAFDRNRDLEGSLSEALANLPTTGGGNSCASWLRPSRLTTAASSISNGPLRCGPFLDPVMAPPDGLEPPTQALGRPRSVH